MQLIIKFVNLFFRLTCSVLVSFGVLFFVMIAFGIVALSGAIFFGVEAGVLLTLLAFYFYISTLADKQSNKVGAVTRGSSEEKRADQVYFLFVLAKNLVMLITAIGMVVILLSFMVFKSKVVLCVHTIAIIMVLYYFHGKESKLAALQKARGYEE